MTKYTCICHVSDVVAAQVVDIARVDENIHPNDEFDLLCRKASL